MKTNKELADTLNWLVQNGRITGLHPASVTEAAKRLVEQGERIRELEAILAANKHAVSVEIVDGPTPYAKEVRLRVDVIDPRPYYASTRFDEYRLHGASDDYLQYIAGASLRMASKAFVEALMPQAMAEMGKAARILKAGGSHDG